MLTLDRLKELILAAEPAAKGRELAWLATKTGISPQAINNWGSRNGVPASNWLKIADALKCSVDALVGRSPSTWPFERFAYGDWEALTERERGAVERAMLDELALIRGQSGKRAANGH